jgi:hypothetical protein
MRIHPRLGDIPVVSMMSRKKATVRFEYFLQDTEKILSPRCPSTNDETGSLLLRRLTLAPSFVDGHCQHFSFSFYVLQKIFKALSQPNRNAILTDGITALKFSVAAKQSIVGDAPIGVEVPFIFN